MKALIIAAAAALTLTGCANDMKLPDWNWAAVTLEPDNYCAITKKVTWSVNDTPETIDQARRHNAKWDRLCGRQVGTT